MNIHWSPLPLALTRERLLTLLDEVIACPDLACLEHLRLAVAGAPAHDVHARMVRDLIALRERELGGRRATVEAAER